MKPYGQYLKERIAKAKNRGPGEQPSMACPKPTTRRSCTSLQSLSRRSTLSSEKDFKANFESGLLKKVDSTDSAKSFHSHRTEMKGNPWTPGKLARAPWAGISALIGTVLCLISGVVILVDADSNPVNKWPRIAQPSILLSFTYGLASVLLSFSLAVGVEISFWRRALWGTTLPELHQHWFSGTSLWGALLGMKKLPWISAATILTTMSLMHGPLLQRAITYDRLWISQNSTISFAAARVLPDGFSGYVTGPKAVTSVLTTNFTAVLDTFKKTGYSPIPMKHDDCGESCQATMEGFGFNVVCGVHTEPFNVEADYDGAKAGAIVFSTSVEFVEGNKTSATAGKIKLEGRYKATSACSGSVIVRRCTLQAGVRRYPVIFRDNSVALRSNSYKNDAFLYQTPIKPAVSGGRSTLGGLAFSIGTMYTSSVKMSYTGNPAMGYVLATTGSTAAVANTTLLTKQQVGADSCSISWYDPVDDILAEIRLLSFQMAVLAANQNPGLFNFSQSTNATGGYHSPVYRANYNYIALALLVSFSGILAVIPTYWGWWELGRQVSMSPIEIAKAFDAPLLEHVDCNGTADSMLKEVGAGKVQYGDVGLSNGRPIDPLLGGGYGKIRRRLEIFDGAFVRKPLRGGEYHPSYITKGEEEGERGLVEIMAVGPEKRDEGGHRERDRGGDGGREEIDGFYGRRDTQRGVDHDGAREEKQRFDQGAGIEGRFELGG